MDMRQIVVPILFVGSLAGLSGCSVGQRLYTEPVGGEKAYLKVTGADGHPLPGTVAISTFKDPHNCRGRYFLQGVPSKLKPTAVTLSYATIPAGRPFTFAVNAPAGVGSYCAPVVEFTPEANRYYVATFSIDQERQRCQLLLNSKADATDSVMRRESVKPLQYLRGMDEDSSFCESK